MTVEGGGPDRLREAADVLMQRAESMDADSHTWESGSTASHRIDCRGCLLQEGLSVAALLRAVADEDPLLLNGHILLTALSVTDVVLGPRPKTLMEVFADEAWIAAESE